MIQIRRCAFFRIFKEADELLSLSDGFRVRYSLASFFSATAKYLLKRIAIEKLRKPNAVFKILLFINKQINCSKIVSNNY